MNSVNNNDNLDIIITGEKKKSRVGLIVFIIIWVFLLGGVLGMIFAKNTFKGNRCNDTVLNAGLAGQSALGNICNCDKGENSNNSNDGSYQDIVRRIDYLSEIEYINRDINNVSELTNQELLKFASLYVEKNKNDFSFTLENVNKVLKSYFNRTIDEGEDIKCLVTREPEFVYLYDSSKKTFKLNEKHSGHGGGHFGDLLVLNRIIDYKIEGSKYIVKVGKAFSTLPDTGFPDKFYRTYDDLEKEKNVLFVADIYESEDGEAYSFPLENFNNFPDDKLAIYEYIFEYKNGEYILVSYKIGK